jgi:hypothetical protein
MASSIVIARSTCDEAIHPAARRKNGLLRFRLPSQAMANKSLAMTLIDMTEHSRGAVRPEFCNYLGPEIRGRREDRVRAAPAISCAKMHKKKRTRAYRFSGGNPAFPAQWFYGLCLALPGDEFVLSPSSADMDCLSPVGPTRLRRLSISNGCQDHTVLPYALAPFVCASGHRSQAFRLRPAIPFRARRRRVHRIPPRVRDDRDTPLWGTGQHGI